MYNSFPSYPSFSSFFVSYWHRSGTRNLFKLFWFFLILKCCLRLFAGEKSPLGARLLFLMHLCIRAYESVSYLVPWSILTNSSQSDTLQVKSPILVNYPSKSERKSLEIYDVRSTMRNYMGLKQEKLVLWLFLDLFWFSYY